jgi:adenosylcobalamin-dependent ribonucleoside-triphosphate reductase
MDLKVRKRDGELVDFDIDKIENAIYQASLEQVTDMEEAKEIAKEVADDINENIILNYEEEIIKVEDIQDRVEFELLNNGYFNIGKSYILYRYNRDKNRDKKSNKNELPDDFISNYKHQPNPFPTELGEYIYYRTYSRYVPEETRREKWWETVRRAVEYNTSLLPTSEDEKKKLFDNIYNFRNFVAGRTLFTAQTGGSEKFPMSNYNCSGVVIDSLDRFTDMFYLLLIGSGTGYRILPEDVEKLPKFRTDVSITHKFYEPVPTDERNEQTEFEFDTDANIVEITVGDSKEAWVKSLEYFLDFLTNSFYRDLEHIIFNYDNIRPKGERLKTFGGEASGFGALKKMYDKLDKVLKNKNTKEYNLKPIDALDFGNIIAENVVSGGVRRSAQIALFDAEDTEVAQAKSNLYTQENGEWKTNEEVAHRTNSNNSIFYRDKPSRDKLNWHVKQMRYTGEPGFVNAVEASKRRKNFEVVNPCSEILLSSQGVCNLTSLNMVSFVNDDNELMLDELLEAQRMSARAGYRMASVDFELNDWDNINKRDMLVGLSVTGWQDTMNLLGWNDFNLPSSEEYEELLEEYKGNEKDLVDTISEMIRTSENYKKQAELMKKMRETGQNAANEIAEEHGTPEPLLVTTVKPEGTQSQMPTVSSGLHFSHSEYYIRRVRTTISDPLLKTAEELNYPIKQDPGKDNTAVIEFPIKAPEGKVKKDVYAIEQLEIYRLFMKNYVDHNASITVHVRDNEWSYVEEWLWNNWDDVVGVSFLSYNDSSYPLMPYEEIDQEEYEERASKITPFNSSIVNKNERIYGGDDVDKEREEEIGSDCEAGVCPVR